MSKRIGFALSQYRQVYYGEGKYVQKALAYHRHDEVQARFKADKGNVLKFCDTQAPNFSKSVPRQPVSIYTFFGVI